MSKKEITIGFDLGVGSVGWAIIDNENKIINWGSRLFNEPELAKNRRGFRSVRRMHRRKQYKNEKFYNIVLKHKSEFGFSSKEEIKNNFVELTKQYPNIIDLKKKIFEPKSNITKNELLWLLHDYLQNRGYFYEVIETEEKPNLQKNQTIIQKNDYNGEFPTQKQINFFEKNGFFKNSITYSADNYSNLFSNKKFTEEIKLLFEKEIVSVEFQNQILKLFTYCRNYADGPGSKNSITPYGRFYYDDNNVLQQHENMWSKLVGKCSYFSEEFRAPKSSCYGEIFNLLEDLVNFRFFENLFSKTKLKIIDVISKKNFYDLLEEVFKKNKVENITITKLLKKIDKKNEPNYEIYTKNSKEAKFTKLESTSKLLNIFNKYYDNEFLKKHLSFKKIVESLEQNNQYTIFDEFDQIIEILSNYNTKEERQKKLKEIFINFLILKPNLIIGSNLEQMVDEISVLTKIGSKRASLSIKAYKKFIPKIYNTFENFESLKWIQIKEKNIDNNLNSTNCKYMNNKFLEVAILPPSVKTTLYESIKVLNKIIKRYSADYAIKNIVIELAREKNSKQQSDSITEYQKLQKNRKENIISKVEAFNIPGFSIDKLSNTKLLKLILFFEQDQIDIYSGEHLNINRVLNDSSYCEIDHIIPYSLSANDSFSNKVLVKRSSNQQKGQQLPLQYIRKHETEQWNVNKYKTYIAEQFGIQTFELLSLKKDTFKSKLELKKQILLLEEYEPETFLSRNINDTRYATKLFKDNLLEFANKRFGVQNINGNVTSFFRKKAQEYWDKAFNELNFDDTISKQKHELLGAKENQILIKDRNKFLHHAVDAAIIALIYQNNPSLKSLSLDEEKYIPLQEGEKILINVETGELKEMINSRQETKYWNIEKTSKTIFNSIFKNIFEGNMPKFSRKLSLNSNLELFNSTLYSIQKINDKFCKTRTLDLFNSSNKKLDNFFINLKQKDEKLLICKSHSKEYNKLKEIYVKWKQKANKKQNPFVLYMADLCKNADEMTNIPIKTLYDAKKVVIIDDLEKRKFSVFRKLKYISNSIKLPNVMLTKKQNNKSFHDTLNSIGFLVYKNKESKFEKICINAKILHFGVNLPKNLSDEKIYIESELLEQKKLKNIDLNSKPQLLVKLYTCLKRNADNSLWFVSGVQTVQDVIEIKLINEVIFKEFEDENGEKRTQQERTKIKLVEFMNDYTIVNIDELGNFN
ncbi:type II CRISPR RNA-guided endonuclease Cas9 [Metamycoplasma equirhinis]|uniref:type II CRISPR RNA-guided endonuclease Cas9 n=1 Tax=Metamycoplasma equirhinis TaxID=92402 RepID=UPI003593FBA3